MNKASVSVVIPSYNSSDTIERAINSISKQILLPKEVIIVDDCSNDGRTENVIKSLAEKYKMYFEFKLIKNKINSGPGVSRNIGWDNSEQDYIAFLDADDAWHERKIELQYKYMINNPDVDFSCHGNKVILGDIIDSEEGNLNEENFKIENITFKQLLFRNKVGTRTVMLKRSINRRFFSGKYHAEDYLLWLEIASSDYKMIKSNAQLSLSFSHAFLGDGLSSSIIKMFTGVLDTYKLILNKNLISRPQYIVVVSFASIRFIRRLIIFMLFKKKK